MDRVEPYSDRKQFEDVHARYNDGENLSEETLERMFLTMGLERSAAREQATIVWSMKNDIAPGIVGARPLTNL